MTKFELEHDQITEGKRRKEMDGEENVHYIHPVECQYVDYINPGTFRATIVGAFVNHRWHRFMYSAYHIIKPDGTKDTIPAQSVLRTRLM